MSWHSRDRKWRAQIRVGGKKKLIGSYDSIAEAKAAYDNCKADLHPFSRSDDR